MKKNSPLASQIGDLPEDLSEPAKRALAGAALTSLDKLAKVSEADIRKLHGLGPNAIKKLRLALSEAGLSFSD